MAIETGSLEYNLILTFTLIVLVTKLILSIFLGKKIYDKWKETRELSFGFITSVFVMMVCLFISRILFMQYDFVYTKFDPNLFHLYPAILYWKTATLISMIGYATFLFTIDRKILDFKYKGIFSYIILGLALIAFFYPVSSSQDLEYIGIILLFANVVAIIIPILFFNIGKNQGYKKPAYMTAIGIIIFAIGANIVNESLVNFLEGYFGGARVLLYLLSVIIKVTGLVTFSYGITKFISIFK